jgi:hypothetical protein
MRLLPAARVIGSDNKGLAHPIQGAHAKFISLDSSPSLPDRGEAY